MRAFRMAQWLTGVAGLAATCVITPVAQAADALKVTLPVFTPGYANYFIAADKGYFKEEGLDVEVIKAGGGTATPALMSGKVQFTGSPGSAMSAILRGAPLKLVFVNQDHPSYEIWSGQAGIRTAHDLRGKSVGVISRGDTHELSVRLVLVKDGVDPAAVSFTPLGFGRGRLAGVMSGSLAAASLTLDEVDQVRDLPKLHRVADTKNRVKMVVGGAATSTAVLTANRDVAKRFLRALIKGRRHMLTFKNDALNAVKKRNPKAPRKALELAYRSTQEGATKDGMIPLSVQQQEIDLRSDILGISKDKRRNVSEVFDFSILDEVNRELDTEGWKPQR